MPGLIKQRRKEMKVTQAEMAKHLSISREQYNKWENSLTPTPSERLLRVCRILKMINIAEIIPSFKEATDRDIKMYLRGYNEGVIDYQNAFGSEYYLYDFIEERHPDIAFLEISIIQNLIKSGSSIRVLNKKDLTSPEFSFMVNWTPDDFVIDMKVRNEKQAHYLSFPKFDALMYDYAKQCSRFSEYILKDLTALLRKYNR